jgi:hypothetical protein
LIDVETSNIKALIKFQEVRYNPLVKKQQFNELDFFSYFGGLLGLFAGISVLSIVEAIYWFTVRVFESKLFKFSTKVDPGGSLKDMSNKTIQFVTKFFKESSIHGFRYLIGSNIVQRYEKVLNI